jgi:DNA-binding NarL/FixJ family response regulator
MGPLRILLVDDHALFRSGLRELLTADGFEIAGEAQDGATAVAMVQRRRPDVVLMDLDMPGCSGADATREILALGDPPAVVVLTGSATDEDLLDALGAGASGYVLKGSRMEVVGEALRAAAAGESVLSPVVVTRLVARVRGMPATNGGPTSDDLTAREREVLRLLGTGCDNGAIANALVISPHTAKRHVASVLHKLGIRNRAQAAVYAARHGIA